MSIKTVFKLVAKFTVLLQELLDNVWNRLENTNMSKITIRAIY